MQSILVVSVKTWLLLLAGPVLFFLAIVGASVFLGLKGVDATQIAERVPLFMPQILLGVLLSLGLIIFFMLRVGAVWTLPEATQAKSDVAIGVLVGGLLAVSYIFWMSPALEVLQRALGDYVPAGSVLATVSGSIGLFFIANVMLAPLVEETLYRAYAIPLLTTQFGVARAVGISCLLFGLLHWPGGIWYMLLTGGIAGGAFAALFIARGGILAPFAAHMTLNLIEFIYAWRIQHTA
jgi:membrane protease YdiL (CAAX protease family)